MDIMHLKHIRIQNVYACSFFYKHISSETMVEEQIKTGESDPIVFSCS